MDRNDKEPSISPTPDSDTTNQSVQTIIAKQSTNNATINNSSNQSDTKRNDQHLPSNLPTNQTTIQLDTNEDTNGHLYNTPSDLVGDGQKGKQLLTEPVVSQNPNINNASASSSVTLISSSKKRLPLNIWLGTVQLLLSVALTALGGLVIARAASLSNTGSGIWAGGICGITGALGVINVRKAQTGFLAVSLICVASSTLAIALTGIGLVRDYNGNASKGAISAGSGLLMTLTLHFLVSVLSIYYLALKLCIRRDAKEKSVNEIAAPTNSTYLSQQRVEQYFKSLAVDPKLKNYPAIIHRNLNKSPNEKNYGHPNVKEKCPEMWMAQAGRKQIPSPVVSNPRQMVLVPAGRHRGSGIPIMTMYGQIPLSQQCTLPPLPPRPLPPIPLPPPSMIYPHVPPGFIPYQPFPMRMPPQMENIDPATLDRIRSARQTKERRGKHARRKSESDIETRRAFTYTGLDREIAENFLEQQEKFNESNLDCTSLDDNGKCPADVAM